MKPLGIKVTIVEPGAFRTDWGGSSMTIHEVSPDYQRAVGAMHDLRRANEGKEAGDPARAARILIDIVNHPQPPLRLLLGAGAVAAAERASDARAGRNRTVGRGQPPGRLPGGADNRPMTANTEAPSGRASAGPAQSRRPPCHRRLPKWHRLDRPEANNLRGHL